MMKEKEDKTQEAKENERMKKEDEKKGKKTEELSNSLKARPC
jgi:hypothetical protein